MPNLWLDSFNNLIICTKGQKWGSNYGRTGEKYDLFTGLLQDWKPFQKPNSKLSVLYGFGSFNEGLRNQIRCHGGQSNCILIPSNTPQNWAMKQLIHNTASYLPRLQSLEHCQAFIIPSPRVKLRRKLKPYIAPHCGPDIIISPVCGLSQGALLMQEFALDKTLKKLFSGSSAALWLCYHQNSSHWVDVELLPDHGACLKHLPKLSLVSSHGGLTSDQ